MENTISSIKKAFLNIFKLEELKIHVKLRILALAVILPMSSVVLILFFLINSIYIENLNSRMENETALIYEKYKGLELKTKILTKLASSDAEIIRGVQLKKMSLVITSLQLFAKELNISFSAAYDNEGYSLGKGHKPKEFFKNESYELFYKKGISAKKNIDAEIFETKEGTILMSISPIYSTYDSTVFNGIIVGGYIFNDALALELKGESKAEIIFEKNNKLIGSTLENIDTKNIMAQIQNKNSSENKIFSVYNKTFNYEAKILKNVKLSNGDILKIIVLVDFSKEKSIIENSFLGIILAVLISLTITFLLVAIISRKIETPIHNLENVSKAIMEKNYEVRATVTGNDEIGVLSKSVNNMLDKIITMNTELEEKVKERTYELESSMDTLKNTQKQLIESEKMAALGGLVAGVAHEINTPIGVCLTAASYLNDKTEEFEKIYLEENIQKEDLDDYMEIANDTSKIIMKNIESASELIHSFKQVAVDQTNEEKRVFNIKEYIETILQSLYPKWKKTKHRIEVQCEGQIELFSYPGAFHQILSNLIMNSLIHGFEGVESGLIEIKVSEDTDNINLLYTDNGVGMSKENLEKIYEPFFTTKRGQGGSGLGMNIVYNIISQKLNGSIAVKSELGKGISFEVHVPKSNKN